MSIDEAIEQFKYDAECNRADLDISYAEENEQIAEWLEELKALRHEANEWRKAGYAHGYNNAIDDYRTEICKAFVQEERNGNYRFYAVEIKQLIVDLAEQLKEGGADACGI